MTLKYDSPLGVLARLPLRMIPRDAVVRVIAGPNRGLRWVVGSSTHGCWLGTYEREKQLVLERFVSPGMIVVDAGANAGYYTLAFSRWVGPEGRVFALEPFAENARNLLRHVSLNRLENITLVQAALSSRPGLGGFEIAQSNSMGSLTASGKYLVPVMSVDDLVAHHGVPVPDVIKMDVEGGESAALEGAKNVLAARKTVIALSLHGPIQKAECLDLLRAAHYRIHRIDGSVVEGNDDPEDEIFALPPHQDFPD